MVQFILAHSRIYQFLMTVVFITSVTGCSVDSPTEPLPEFGSDVVSAKIQSVDAAIFEGQTAQVTIKFNRKIKVKAYVDWEVRFGIGRFLKPTGVLPVEAGAETATLTFETFRNQNIDSVTDFEILISSDAFAAPVTAIVRVTDQSVPAVLNFMVANPFVIPTAPVNSASAGTIVVQNNGEVLAKTITANALSSELRYVGGSYPGTGGTCGTSISAGASCILKVEAYMPSAGTYNKDLVLNYFDGAVNQTATLPLQSSCDSVIASLTGLPSSPSKIATLNITVGGAGIVGYKAKVGPSSTTDCSNSSGYSGAEVPVVTPWTPIVSGFPDGSLKLCVIGKNGGGLWQSYAGATFHTWTKDTTPPTVIGTGITVNNGSVRTNLSTVDLQLSASEAQFMYITNSAGCNSGGVWEVYDTTKPWNLSFLNAPNSIYVKFRDALGNETSCLSSTITHDSLAPSVVINQDPGQPDPTLVVPIRFVIDFTEDVQETTVNSNTIQQTGTASGIQWSITKVTNSKYYLDAVSVDVGGTIIPKVIGGLVLDLAGNPSSESTAMDASVSYNSIEFYFKAIAVGDKHTCATANDGRIFCWGDNSDYQLGYRVIDNPPAGAGPEDQPPTGFKIPTELLPPLTANFVSVSLGYNSACAIDTTGKIRCTGRAVGNYNTGSFACPSGCTENTLKTYSDTANENVAYGSCGSAGSSIPKYDFISASMGRTHFCVVDGDHQLSCIGRLPETMGIGKIGISTCNFHSFSRPGGKNVRLVSSGGTGTCVVNGVGDIYCLGKNNNGQLGIGNTVGSDSWQKVNTTLITAFDGFKNVSSGEEHVCAVAFSGLAYCWGRGDSGQIGDASSTNRLLPTAVNTSGIAGFKKWLDVKAGKSHSCGLTSDGKVYCWGDYSNGKLGSVQVANSNVPVAVMVGATALANVISIDTKTDHTCALTNDGKVLCWGDQSTEGRLGNNTTTFSTTPVLADTTGLLGKRSTRQMSAGADHTCAVGTDGKISCWGKGSDGQLGDGTSDRTKPTPINAAAVGTGNTFVKVASGEKHSCAITTLGKAYCWGQNPDGQLGNGSFAPSTTPVEVDVNIVGLNDPGTPEDDFVGFTDISVGLNHSCAMTSDGKIYCWGQSLYGQTGAGTLLSLTKPTAVVLTAPNLSRFWKLDAGHNHTCAVTGKGKAFCWGWGSLGRLGDNSTNDSSAPKEVNTVLNANFSTYANETFNNIAAGGEHTCGTMNGVNAYCWGNGSGGRLGNSDGTYSVKLVPANMDLTGGGGLVKDNFKSIDAGKEHTCGINHLNKVFCWGEGTKGRIGDNFYLLRSRPVSPDFTDFVNYVGSVATTAGNGHSCSSGVDGELYCWGEGVNGRLGNNETSNKGKPIKGLFP